MVLDLLCVCLFFCIIQIDAIAFGVDDQAFRSSVSVCVVCVCFGLRVFVLSVWFLVSRALAVGCAFCGLFNVFCLLLICSRVDVLYVLLNY